MSEFLLEVKDLSASFHNGHRQDILDGVSLKVKKGEITALVGESGCGKTMTALSITRLMPKSLKLSGGEVFFAPYGDLKEHDLLKAKEDELNRIRGKEITYIFQEPSTSLNPVLKIKDQLIEALSLHRGIKGKEALEAAAELLRSVGIPSVRERLESYPHELSIGMKQRVMIAMAISADPKLLIADEPTTALDATIQSGILNLLKKLRDAKGISILLITHDLSLVERYADFVFVMHKGRILECAPTAFVFQKPIHPYTISLLNCVPKAGHYKEPFPLRGPCKTIGLEVSQYEMKNLPSLSEVEARHWARIPQNKY